VVAHRTRGIVQRLPDREAFVVGDDGTGFLGSERETLVDGRLGGAVERRVGVRPTHSITDGAAVPEAFGCRSRPIAAVPRRATVETIIPVGRTGLLCSASASTATERSANASRTRWSPSRTWNSWEWRRPVRTTRPSAP